MVWGRFRREGIYVYLWQIHFVVQHKLIQHGKAIILQFYFILFLYSNLKKNVFKKQGAQQLFLHYSFPSLSPFPSILQPFGSWPQSSLPCWRCSHPLGLMTDLVSSSWPLIFSPWMWFSSILWPHPVMASESPSARSRLDLTLSPTKTLTVRKLETHLKSNGEWTWVIPLFQELIFFPGKNDEFLTNWRTMKTNCWIT